MLLYSPEATLVRSGIQNSCGGYDFPYTPLTHSQADSKLAKAWSSRPHQTLQQNKGSPALPPDIQRYKSGITASSSICSIIHPSYFGLPIANHKCQPIQIILACRVPTTNIRKDGCHKSFWFVIRSKHQILSGMCSHLLGDSQQ